MKKEIEKQTIDIQEIKTDLQEAGRRIKELMDYL
jgi:hypothetical protein